MDQNNLNTLPIEEDKSIRSVNALFDLQVATHPEKIAIIYQEQQFTYNKLNKLSNTLAQDLIKAGVKPDSLVGVCLKRSPELIISILAIIKAGGAYLPIDSNHPLDRIKFMLSDANAEIVITTSAFEKNLENFSKVFTYDNYQDYAKDITHIIQSPTINEENLIYVNYTSGSTGQPKGVAITHRSVLHLLRNPSFVKLDLSTVTLQLAPAAFDAFTFECWGALISGGTCILHHESLPTLGGIRESIIKNHVTTMFITTSLFNLIIDEDPSILSSLNQIIVGGEALSVKHIRTALSQLANVEIINAYGPTECTTFSTTHSIQIPDCDLPSIPIGKPVNQASVYILDDSYQEVPVNTIGNIYIGGPGLARGYLNLPDLTAKKFLSNLSFLNPDQRLYQTGDLGRKLDNGSIEYIGRVDNQVKIHGFRIELEEIESALQSHEQIKQAIVTVVESIPNNKKLIAYLVPKNMRMEKSVINTYLRNKIPAYMIPSDYIWLDNIPLTANGKLDRHKIISMNEV